MLLCIAMQATVFTVNGIKYGTSYGDMGGYLPWFDKGHDAVVLGPENASYSGELIIPENVNFNGQALTVKYIGDYAFEGCNEITSLSIGKTVRYIGYQAFMNCTKLASFNIPNSVDIVQSMVFYNTAWYNSLPDGLVYKENVLFGSKGAIEGHLDIPEGTRVIATSAFAQGFDIKSIKIPGSVESICSGAFVQAGFSSVTIPSSVKLIEKEAFMGCMNLETIVVDKDNAIYDSRNNCNAIIETSTNKLLAGCRNTVIPNTVTAIEEYAFRSHFYLQSIVIPNSVKSIGDGAFHDCRFMESVFSQIEEPFAIYSAKSGIGAVFDYDECTLFVPVGTKTKYEATDGWKNFKNIEEMEYESEPYEVDIKNDQTVVIKSMRVDKTGKLTIPEKVEVDGVEYTVTRIAANAFKDNTELREVTIPNTVINIGVSAFKGCINLTSAVLGNSLRKINSFAFKDCVKLSSFNIPNSVEAIGKEAFADTDWYNNLPNGLVYKDNVLLGYKGNEPSGHLDIANGTRLIAQVAFSHCGLTSISIPNTVVYIGEQAFLQTEIESLILPNSVTTIGYGAFGGSYNLKSVTLPQSLTDIESKAFSSCALTKVYSKIKEPFYIDSSVFDENPDDLTLYVPAGTKALYESTEGWNMFENIVEMEPEPYEVKDDQTVVVKELEPDETGKVEIPEKVEIDNVEYTVTEIAEDAFKGNTELTEVTIPRTVTTIGSGAFEGCTNLKAIYVLSPTPASLAAAVSSRAQHKVASTAVSHFEGIDLETCVLYVPFGSEQAYREAEGWKEFKHIVGVHGETDPMLMVTAKSYSREYGEENPEFEFTTEGATLDGEPIIECEATAVSAVGTYDIIVKKGSVENYNDTYVKGTLTITKAPLTVKVEDVEREQGKENPQFVLTYTGWKNNETESVLTKKPMATTTATKDSPAGMYDIVVNGGEAQNYTLSYVSGKLTVTVPSGIYDATHQMDNGQWTMDDWYDLSGRKLNHGLKSKGVYIVNGRKVVIK